MKKMSSQDRSIRAVGTAVLLGVTVFPMAGCERGENQQATSQKTIGVTLLTVQHQFYQDLRAGLQQEAKDVVNVVGDGSFIYGCPTSSLWCAGVYEAPFLSIIYNNQIHNAPKRSLLNGIPDSYSERLDKWEAMELSPSVDFAMLAQSCHAYGEKVEDPNDVPAALKRALGHVRDGQPAVLDVRIERP